MKSLREWWRGRYVPMDYHESGGVASIGGGYYVRPPAARVLVPCGKFIAKHWQWFASTTIAVVLAVVGLRCRSSEPVPAGKDPSPAAHKPNPIPSAGRVHVPVSVHAADSALRSAGAPIIVRVLHRE